MNRLALGVLVFLFFLSGTVLAVDVTQCGQVVPAGQVGVLVAPLDCAGAVTQGFCSACIGPPGGCGADLGHTCATAAECPAPIGVPAQCATVAVGLEDGATLDTNGFALAGVPGDEPNIGIFCSGRCIIQGAGAIGRFGWGVEGSPHRKVRMNDVTVHDNDMYGVATSIAVLKGVTLMANGAYGIAGARVEVTNVTASGNGADGISSTLRLTGSNVTANGNGANGVHYFGGRRGMGRFTLTALIAMGNAGAGVFARGGALLIDSTVIANDGGGQGIDVATGKLPRAVRTTCGKSAMLTFSETFAGPWGICTDD